VNNSITTFFHSDLDGIVSYLALCWALGYKPDYVATTPMKLEQDYDKWVEKKLSNHRLFFLDLDVSKIGHKIDNADTVIIDHHQTNIYPFKHAKARITNAPSCAKMMYEYFLKDKNLSEARKTLIALADDWDSNSKKLALSSELNIVFHEMTNKISSFIQDYYNGFVPFDKFKLNTIALYKKHVAEYLETMEPFFGEIDFEGARVKVGAVNCDRYVAECCEHLFDTHEIDIAIAVMVRQKRIAVRRSPKNHLVDVSKFVQRIASGGGHPAAAGGHLTDEFIEFTKMLKPYK